MRRIVLAVLTAAAVTLGLAATTGTALAAPSQAVPSVGPCVPLKGGGTTCGRGPGFGFRPGAPGTFGRPGAPFIPGGPFGPGHWGGRFAGHEVVLDGGPTLNVCLDGSYTTFVNRYATYRDRINGILGANPEGEWLALHNACTATVVVDGTSNLQLVNGDLLNVSLLGLNGLANVNVCSYSNWTTFDQFATGRFGSRWGLARGHFGHNPTLAFQQLRQRAQCGGVLVAPSSVTNNLIVPQQTTTVEAAPTTVTEQAQPAPMPMPETDPGMGTVQTAPMSAPDTGDGSLAALVS